jgi:cytochrome c peroxidase
MIATRQLLLGFTVALGLLAPSRSDPVIPAMVSRRAIASSTTREHEPIKAIPQITGLDPEKIALGKTLFGEPRLSHDDTISCASCHDFQKGGADGRVHSLGMNQAEGTINTPSVFNCGLNFKQFWDGRAATLEEQVNGPLEAANEMASSWPEVIRKLRAAPDYVAAFARVYADGIEPRNIKNAIAEYERSLTTPNSRFDQFLRGDDAALSAEEAEGYRKFKSYGCTSCHQGVNAGGNMFETLGAMADYFADRGHVTKADYGRFNVTGREEDRFVFKVPSLRNVALTAPYFHDGSAKTLEDAVRVMGKYQLGHTLTPVDIDQIVKFLHTLTGEYGGQPL